MSEEVTQEQEMQKNRLRLISMYELCVVEQWIDVGGEGTAL